MSASSVSESPETQLKNSSETTQKINSRYALYLFSNNKHATSPEAASNYKENSNFTKDEIKTDSEEPSICLSLLEGNLCAEQETVVRCFLLKTLSVREDLSFENEGKYATLQLGNGDADEPFGCYYHRLSKHSDVCKADLPGGDGSLKLHTFFICLIGPSNGVMESFCPELGKLCQTLIPLLDPEGLKSKEDVQLKLNSWYPYSVGYIERCQESFNQYLPILLTCSLWGNIEVISTDEDTKWDIERFIETCCLMPQMTDNVQDNQESEPSAPTMITVLNGKIEINKKFEISPSCLKWCDKLSRSSKDPVALHTVLDNFRLKTVQDLNTLKRLLQKAQNDYYALFRAYQFLESSGYEDVLLFHVKREAQMSGEQETLAIITCLEDFIESTDST